MEPATSLNHRLEYLGLRLLQVAVRTMPERWAVGAGARLGRLVGGLGIRRAQVRENLVRAFPDSSAAWKRRIETGTYAHLGAEVTMLLRLGERSRADVREFVMERTSWRTEETARIFARIKADSQAGRGTLLITGHLGNWEVAGGAMAARGLPLDAVAVRQKNPLVDASLRRQRESLGIRVIDRDASPREVPNALRAGRVVALVADQHAAGGLPIPFFGHSALTPRGPAVFARRAGAAVVVGGAVAREGSPRRYEVFLEDVDAAVGAEGKDAQILEMTRSFTAALESWIRQDPSQYMWLHRRWRPAALEAADSGSASLP